MTGGKFRDQFHKLLVYPFAPPARPFPFDALLGVSYIFIFSPYFPLVNFLQV